MKTIMIMGILFISLKIYSQESNIISTKTIITPCLQTTISIDSNIIYCSTFQIAWDELKKIVGGNVVLNTNIELIDLLNKSPEAKQNINNKDYLVLSGIITQTLIDKINKEIKEKFNDNFKPITDEPNNYNFLIYSFLYKNLEFKKAFENYNEIFYFNKKNGINPQKINAFGVNSVDYEKRFEKVNRKRKRLLNQIDAYFVKDQTIDFVVKIKSKNPHEEIILARMRPSQTLGEAINKVLASIENYVEPENVYYRIRCLIIPEIDFEIKKDYNEIVGKQIMNPLFNEYKIVKAYQEIKFNLDKNGTRLKSTSKLEGSSSLGFTPKTYTYFSLIFDSPFLIMLKEKGKSQPYFAAWITNDYLLKKK